jgi:stress response protein YsnF
VSVSNNKNNINLDKVLKKGVVGTDGLDLGEVSEVGDNFIIIQKGLLNKKRYIIPISTIEDFDGDTLRVKVNEDDLLEYEEPDDPQFKDYSKFKSSDMSGEMETKIPVIGENLEIAKKIVEDKVEIIKDPIRETKTVEIELIYEKVSIERIPFDNKREDAKDTPDTSSVDSKPGIEKPVSKDTPDTSSVDSKPGIEKPVSKDTPDTSSVDYKPAIEKQVTSRTQISIPLKREVPVVIKNPYIREEVVIKKKPVKETKTITTDITNEKVSYGENNSETNKKNLK